MDQCSLWTHIFQNTPKQFHSESDWIVSKNLALHTGFDSLLGKHKCVHAHTHVQFCIHPVLTLALGPSRPRAMSWDTVCSRRLLISACCRRSLIRSSVSSSGCHSNTQRRRAASLTSSPRRRVCYGNHWPCVFKNNSFPIMRWCIQALLHLDAVYYKWWHFSFC